MPPLLLLSPSERSDLLSMKDIQGCNQDRSLIVSCNDPKASIDADSSMGANNSSNASKNRNGWSVILFGQTIALALSCSNAASSTLENDYRIRVPTFLTGLVYFVLSFHLAFLFWTHQTRQKYGNYEMIEEYSDTPSLRESMAKMMQPRHKFPFTTLPLHTPWYTYLLLSIMDVEANYLAMLSFQHTSLSSSMLLTSLSALSTVLLRRVVFQKTSYGRTQMLGIFTCLVGGCMWLREEFYRSHAGGADLYSNEESQIHAIRGDLLALSAAFLYGLNDVLAEYFVKANNDRVEYLGMLGFFGAIFSFCVQVPLLEKDRVQKLFAGLLYVQDDISFDYVDNADGDESISMRGVIFLLACFIVLLCFFYMSVMKFLSVHDSTILNLSLQSCPLWAVVLTMLQKSLLDKNGSQVALPPSMFFVSLAMVVTGMFLYERNSGNERVGDNANEMHPGNNDAKAGLDRDYDIEVI